MLFMYEGKSVQVASALYHTTTISFFKFKFISTLLLIFPLTKNQASGQNEGEQECETER